MSLILDALSRSERERRAQEQSVPDLLLAPTTTASHRAPAPGWMIAALLLLLFAAGAWWLWPTAGSSLNPAATGPGTAKSAEDATSAPLAVAPPSVLPAAEDAGAATRTRQEDPDTDAAVRALYARPEMETLSAAEASSGREPTTAAVSPAPPAEAPGDAPEDAGEESKVDIEQVLQAARRTLADGALAPHATPLLGNFSRQFRDRVPTLMYLRHDFANDGTAAVVINGESLRAGQRVDGVLVREILPDSVILRFDGQEFRLRALNSWINL
jgi:general secretion pathway protein B